MAGLRGSLTLIMAADFIIHSDFYSGGPVGELALSWQPCRNLAWAAVWQEQGGRRRLPRRFQACSCS